MPKITIKAARVNAGLSLRDAAKKIGIGYQRLSRYENDPSDITVKLLNRMVEVYGIDSQYLLLKAKNTNRSV